MEQRKIEDGSGVGLSAFQNKTQVNEEKKQNADQAYQPPRAHSK